MKKQLTFIPIETMVVGLDGSEADASVVQYAAQFAQTFDVTAIHFVTVESDLSMPDEVPREYTHVLANVDTGIKRKIESCLEDNFSASGNVETVIEVLEGNPTEELLKYIKRKNADLMVLGRKKEIEGSSILNHAIARKAPCHLLLVPPDFKVGKIQSALMPTDFSRHANLAMQYLLKPAKEKGLDIHCCHTYQLPIGYYKTGKSDKEFSEIMKSNASRQFSAVTKDFDVPVDCEFMLDEKHKPAKTILKIADQLKPDLVVVGSKGRTNLSIIFLGSIAQKMILENDRYPMLIVKHKGENMGVFESLMRL